MDQEQSNLDLHCLSKRILKHFNIRHIGAFMVTHSSSKLERAYVSFCASGYSLVPSLNSKHDRDTNKIPLITCADPERGQGVQTPLPPLKNHKI